MLHAEPFIDGSLEELAAAGCRRIVAIVLSPQFSPVVMGAYLRAVESARQQLGPGIEVAVAGSWWHSLDLLGAITGRLRAALEAIPPTARSQVQVLFTAHSLPRGVAEKDPDYIAQLHCTAAAVAAESGLGPADWGFTYQSAGHQAVDWLTPDVKDVVRELAETGCRVALVAPVQFVSDHLELLYDIDVAAATEASEWGVELRRIPALNTSPLLIQALASVVKSMHPVMERAARRDG
jgi:ferrochelatase